MSNILEVLGKGLEPSLMSLLLPRCKKLSQNEISHYEQQIHERPEDIAFVFTLGVHYASVGATDKAQELFNQILLTDSKHLDTYLAWAALCSSTGYVDESILKLQDAYEIFPEDPRILFALGYCYERLGEYKKADQDLIKNVNLFDLYQGEHIDPGKKAIAFKITLQAADRTLTDHEMAEVQNKIFGNLENMGGVIRGK